MILGEDNRKAWSPLDVLIMQAYQITLDERCSQCGLPRWLCHNDDPRLQVKVAEDFCYASSEVELKKKEQKEGDPGSSFYPEFYTVGDETPLIEFRALYYEQLAREAAELEVD